jgi:hypothetical protein
MRMATPLLKNLFARGLLALVLVFAQQQAALHWLSHAIEATHGKAASGPLANDHCDECLALNGLAAGATSTPHAFPLEAAHHVLVAASGVAVAPAQLRLAFRSRAPPILT